MTHSNMVAENIPPVPKMPSDSMRASKGPPLQARSATGAASGNKDLINFIRDGPEEQGSHRISRSVAPFRNTMDSDQFGEMGGDFTPAAPSMPSMDPHVNGVSPSHGRSTSNTPTQPLPLHRKIPSTSENIPAQRPAAVVPEPEDDGHIGCRSVDHAGQAARCRAALHQESRGLQSGWDRRLRQRRYLPQDVKKPGAVAGLSESFQKVQPWG